jgi:hypothetical protein
MSELKIPVWFWVVAVIGLLWNAMGVMAFIQSMMMTTEALMKLSEAEQQLIKNTPAWANQAFAIAVFAGFIGCLLMIFKRKLALPILIVSLLAVLVQMYNAFFIMDSIAVFGPGGAIMPAMVIVIGILLIWLAKFAISKAWLK